jgi:GNAT superfamily N-acetyltransferase
VRLANVITLPDHRGRGYGMALVIDVLELGFTLTSVPRMKFVL